MTPQCAKTVLDLQNESEVFADLTVEQLLYAAIAGTCLSEVKYILETMPEELNKLNIPFKEN